MVFKKLFSGSSTKPFTVTMPDGTEQPAKRIKRPETEPEVNYRLQRWEYIVLDENGVSVLQPDHDEAPYTRAETDEEWRSRQPRNSREPQEIDAVALLKGGESILINEHTALDLCIALGFGADPAFAHDVWAAVTVMGMLNAPNNLRNLSPEVFTKLAYNITEAVRDRNPVPELVGEWYAIPEEERPAVSRAIISIVQLIYNVNQQFRYPDEIVQRADHNDIPPKEAFRQMANELIPAVWAVYCYCMETYNDLYPGHEYNPEFIMQVCLENGLTDQADIAAATWGLGLYERIAETAKSDAEFFDRMQAVGRLMFEQFHAEKNLGRIANKLARTGWEASYPVETPEQYAAAFIQESTVDNIAWLAEYLANGRQYLE